MKLEVYPNKKRKGKLLFAQILCLAAAAAIVWFLNLGFIKDLLREARWGFWLFVGFLILFLLLFAACFYFRNRPRIRVSGQSVTFYPLLTPAKQVTWSEITARQVNLDCTGDPKATAATVAGGVIGYAIYQSLQQSSLDSAQALSPDRDWKFTYYQGGKKLISILSRESEHALEFDEMVRAHLAGAPMPAMQAGGECAAPEQKSRGKAPVVIACVLLAVCVLAVSGMYLYRQNRPLPPLPSADQPQASPLPAQPEESAAPLTATCKNVTFAIDPAWSVSDGYDGVYMDEVRGVVYHLNGVSPLSPYTPEEFYNELLEFYQEENSPVLGGPLEESTGADGARRYMANLQMVQDDTYYMYFTLVVCPEQDVAITFGAQTLATPAALYEEEIIRTVEHMADTAVYTPPAEQDQDLVFDAAYFAGTAWTASNDNSQWVFDADGSFHWYQSRQVTDDNYYAGTYQFYVGQEAWDYLLAYFSDMGLTEEDLLGVINDRPEYSLERFVCLVATNESFLLDGEEQLSAPTQTHYFGFLLENGSYLNIANMTTGSSYAFTKDP